jgi:hypothetical protein
MSAALAGASIVAFAWTTTGAQEAPSLAVDVGIEGNGPLEVSRTEDCISVGVGDRFDIDFVIDGVTDLLAWEAFLSYDPAVVIVVEHDVRQFQEANVGSSVIDVSAPVPDDSGFHKVSAVETSDPPTPDSGSGTLARLTLEARGEGESPLEFGARDIDGDAEQDQGTLLKDLDAMDIGDEDGDSFFDGEQADALVVVGDECPEGSIAAEAGGSDSGGSSIWVIVGGAAAFALVVGVALGAWALFFRRRSARPTDSTDA